MSREQKLWGDKYRVITLTTPFAMFYCLETQGNLKFREISTSTNYMWVMGEWTDGEATRTYEDTICL